VRRFVRREEAARRDSQSRDLLVVRLDAVDDRQLALWLGNHLRRREAFAGRQHLEPRHRRLHRADVLEGEAWRLLPHFLIRLNSVVSRASTITLRTPSPR
jgi:hypothetical protein